MSSPSLTAEDVKGIMSSNYVSFATSALFIHEYLITIDKEMQLIWNSKWTMSTLLFLVNRYVSLVVAIIYALPVINYAVNIPDLTKPSSFTDNLIYRGVYIIKVTILIQLLVIALFSAQRVYVVTHCKKWVTAFIFLIAIIPFAVNIWVVVVDTLIYLPKVSCISAVLGRHELSFRRTSVAATIADILVIIFIFKQSYTQWREQRQLFGKGPSFVELLLRDGSIYFLAMMIINVFYVLDNTLPYLQQLPPTIAMVQRSVFHYIPNNPSNTKPHNLLLLFLLEYSIPPIITSRMLLNIREVAGDRSCVLIQGDSISLSQWMSEPLQPGVGKDCDDESGRGDVNADGEENTRRDGGGHGSRSNELELGGRSDERAVMEVQRTKTRMVGSGCC
ncbi:hypothetical protein BDY19DRAFT_990107 [Irpex rosettiformis]|uniref:Uncharacterized protein n=1 Tax=Irpex rosettiformis TaxID=378272 RepID=A0ACB8UGC8_9APHY|nr:hypothetical protein BDY19DRAFT_990107 [Irpex rosettiformis]